jgi:hypothetical protein
VAELGWEKLGALKRDSREARALLLGQARGVELDIL